MYLHNLIISSQAESMYLDLSFSVEDLQALRHSLNHRHLALTDPVSGIVVLFVWLVLYHSVNVGLGKQEMARTAPSGFPIWSMR